MTRDRADVVAVTVVRIVKDMTRAGKTDACAIAAVTAIWREEFTDIERQIRNELRRD